MPELTIQVQCNIKDTHVVVCTPLHDERGRNFAAVMPQTTQYVVLSYGRDNWPEMGPFVYTDSMTLVHNLVQLNRLQEATDCAPTTTLIVDHVNVDDRHVQHACQLVDQVLLLVDPEHTLWPLPSVFDEYATYHRGVNVERLGCLTHEATHALLEKVEEVGWLKDDINVIVKDTRRFCLPHEQAKYANRAFTTSDAQGAPRCA